jgi:hypothetical protein
MTKKKLPHINQQTTKFIYFFLLISMISAQLLKPNVIQAINGHPAGPCMPPHDPPSVGGVTNGDSNTQTYQAPAGRTITRICVAATWSDGKVDHSSHYANSTDDCYNIAGIGTSQVTVKRLAETYSVPAWQTGPEAGKCHPLSHLDVFLNESTASPTTQPTSTATSPSPFAASPTVTSPSPSPFQTTPKPTPQSSAVPIATNTADDSNDPGTILGSTEVNASEPNPTKVVDQSNFDFRMQAWLTTRWWLIAFGILLLTFTLFWLKSKKR